VLASFSFYIGILDREESMNFIKQCWQNLKDGFAWPRIWWTVGYMTAAVALYWLDNDKQLPLWQIILSNLKWATFYYFFYTRGDIPNHYDDDDGDDEYTEEYLKQEHGKIMQRGIVNNA
jgi:hypothetical protein